MGDLVNLRRERKRRARERDAAAAADNRVAHGLTKSARDAAAATRRLAERALDGRRLDAAESPDGDER